MKIGVRIVAAAIALAPLVIGNSAFADGICQVGYTGPNSNNECSLTSTYTCTVKNNNDFDIKNENNQVVGSGTASSTGSTTGGSATTGSATNSNGSSINVTISNGDSGKLCTVVSTVPAIPTLTTPPAEQVTPGRGAAGAAPAAPIKQTVQAPQKNVPAALPNTSGDWLSASLMTLTGLLAAGVITTRLAVLAYSHIKP